MASIRELFATQSVRADYKGQPARLLPVTADTDIEKRGAIAAGKLLCGYKTEVERDGVKASETKDAVFSGNGKAEGLAIKLPRSEGGFQHISMTNPREGALELPRTVNRHRDDIAAVEKANAEQREAYDAAVDRGETVEEPEEVKTYLTEDALENTDRVIQAVREANVAELDSRLTNQNTKADIEVFLMTLGKLTASELTSAEVEKAKEYRKLRTEIGVFDQDHELAITSAANTPFEGETEQLREVAATLPNDSSAQMAAASSPMSRIGDQALIENLFKVATTMPIWDIVRNGGQKTLSQESFVALNDELMRHHDKEATDKIVPRMQAVTEKASADYTWEGRIFTKDDVDILVMRDRQAAWAYAWPTEARVEDIDVAMVVDDALTREDVPTDAQLETAKEVLDTLRNDVGDVDFGWMDDFDNEADAGVDFGDID